jgi:predicted nucleotidyltransferase
MCAIDFARRVVEPMSELKTHTQVCPTADDVIATLRAHEAELRAAGIKRLSLFGSIARGDAGPESDVEFAVVLDRAAHIGLIGLSALERRIADLIGHEVHLVPEPVESPHLREYIGRDCKLAF